MASDDHDGYRLLQVLSPGKTFLCADLSENLVVLKRLEDDCLHRGQLHPSIKDRLARVRGLAHPRLATLRTAQRWENSACLIWDFLPGKTWDDATVTDDEHLYRLVSALAESVYALHQHGIVHGSLHGRNVIVRGNHQVWLAHVSPYLYTDHMVDIFAVADLVRTIVARCPTQGSAQLLEKIAQLEAGECTLRDFSHLVLILNEPPAPAASSIARDGHYRLSSLIAAVVIAGCAFALWGMIHHLEANPTRHGPPAFPSLLHTGNP